MNIIMFIDSLAGGGAQRQFVNLAIGLFERGHKVCVKTYYPHEFFKLRLAEAEVPTELFKKQHRFDLMPAKQLSTQIRAEKADITIAFLKTPCIYAEMAKILNPKVPLVVSERCGINDKRLKLKDRVRYQAHRLATCVTTNSHDNRLSIINAVPSLKSRTHVIYNGVQEAFFKQGERKVERITNKTNNQKSHDDAPFRFCAIAARPSQRKGLLDLINAAIKLHKNNQNFTIDWIGPANSENRNIILAKQLLAEHNLTSHWNWVGKANDVDLLLPKYDAFILPSQIDGVANTLCEAMSCALPVIATDIHDNSAILNHGLAGLLCESENPESMAEAMLKLSKAPQHELNALSKAAFEISIEQFQMKKYLDHWENLCVQTCAPSVASKT